MDGGRRIATTSRVALQRGVKTLIFINPLPIKLMHLNLLEICQISPRFASRDTEIDNSMSGT